MSKQQTFTSPEDATWVRIDFLPSVGLLPLAQPVPDGSIHRTRLAKGTTIPVHTHPVDEFVLVLSGTIETGGRRCDPGTFWTAPAGTRQGPPCRGDSSRAAHDSPRADGKVRRSF
jgi:quercetin dioxygenase-like cupin family protein